MLCRKQFITAFPMIRVYRHGSDDIETDGHHEHESYHGDRTKVSDVEISTVCWQVRRAIHDRC